MFKNYYKEVQTELKQYIYISEKDFNNSPKNVRKLLLHYAKKEMNEKYKKHERIQFNDIPYNIRKYIEMDKDTFEKLDILCQQFIIEYIYKYNELLIFYGNKQNQKSIIKKINDNNNILQEWLFNLNFILKNKDTLNYINNIIKDFKNNMNNNYKNIRRLRANIRNNKKKIINNLIKKDKIYYENKILNYEKNLEDISKLYTNKKHLYFVFNNIIQLSKNIL